MSEYYVGRVEQTDIDRAGDERPGTSPLLHKIRRVLGSTCRLRGVRVYRGDTATSLCLAANAAKWQEQWEAGVRVGPLAIWVVSRPGTPETLDNQGAVKRRSP